MLVVDKDPHPELRCRCVAKFQVDFLPRPQLPNAFYDRCLERATQEDGYCDHCRSRHIEPFVFADEVLCSGKCCQTDLYVRADVTDPRTPCLRIDKGDEF